MPEPDNPNSNPKKPAAEISVEKRLLLAFALMGAVLFITQYFFPQSPQSTLKPAKQATTPQQAQTPPARQPTGRLHLPHRSAGQIAATTSDLYTIQTDVFKVVFSNHGAVVRSWELMKYRDGTGKPLELVNTFARDENTLPVLSSI